MAKPKRKPKPSPDQGLAPEQFAELNAGFYASPPPHQYLRTRLRAIVLTSVDPEQLPEGFGRKFTLNDFTISWKRDESDDDPTQRSAFLSAESTVLLHHAAEAIVRLFLAHDGRPACPWLEASRRFVWKERLTKLQRELREPDAGHRAMHVFFGYSERPENFASVSAEDWSEAEKGIVRLLRQTVQLLIDDGPLYNAAKHGLAIVAGNARVAFGDGTGPLKIESDGPAVSHLEVLLNSSGLPAWNTATTWVNAERNLAMVEVICQQLENLWNIATARYANLGASRFSVRPITVESLDIIGQGGRPLEGVRASIPSMRMSLLYRSQV